MSEEKDNRTGPGGKGNGPGAGRALLVWLVLMGLLWAGWQWMGGGKESGEGEMAYQPDFLQALANREVVKAVFVRDGGESYIKGELKGQDKEGNPETFRVNAPMSDELMRKLEESGAELSFAAGSGFWKQLVGQSVSFLLIFGLIYFLFYRRMGAGGGAFTFGKSRARLMGSDAKKVTFKDVAGVEEAKEEVQEIIDFLKDPKKFQRLGGRIPKGVLLAGPPGTGKTLIARAIAGEAGVPFFSISGSDFVEMFVGVGASRVRDMFEQGKKSAPCIIFIDEIDAVGRSRFSGIGGGHDEREQTLNALLVEMDGFDAQEGIIIIAATNRPDVLDPALLRPGRFDRQIVVGLPTLAGREAILKIHARKVKLGPDADLKKTARGTPGFSGADLANLMNEAALLAARRGAEAIGKGDLEEARDKVCWGRERKSFVMDDKEKRMTAVHETGHAITLALSEGTEPLHKVTIIPRGQALGATFQLPEKDKYTKTRTSLLGEITGAMGGRAAEQLVYGEVTTGASADIKQATAMARRMVTEWGMSDAMGPQFYGTRDEVLFLGREVNRSHDLSDDTARQIDAEVKRILDEAYARAEGILRERRKELDEITELLMEKETIEGRDVTDILTHGRVLSQKERDEEDAAKEAESGGEAAKPAEAKADEGTQEAEKEAPEGTPESGGGE